LIEEKNPIDASKVTKPIQLLAAWLAGLVAINGSFLTAAGLITSPSWGAGLLIISAVINVPLFLACLFLLQTKFRPEMQEDSFYSRHLERRYSLQSQQFVTVAANEKAEIKKEIKSSASGRVSEFIWANDLLPNFKEILAALNELNLRPSETFGSTSVDPVTPSKFIVTIGQLAPINVARQVLRECEKLDMDGVGYDTEYDQERILIGAYSYDDETNFVPFPSPDYDRLMAPTTNRETFLKILSKFDSMKS